METEKRISFLTEEGKITEFEILEETRLAGINYLLVTDAAEDAEEGECYVLKDTSGAESADAVYEFVEEEDELESVFAIFTELMEEDDTVITK